MFFKQNHKIILASTSSIRKKILSDAGLKFEAISPDFDEDAAKKNLMNLSAKEKSLHLACGKALSISKKFPDAFVIGSDQVCQIGDFEVEKSRNSTQAIEQLKKLNGKKHSQNNAVVVAFKGKIIFKNFSKADLQMRKLGDDEILSYVTNDNPIGSAGSYKYESFGKHLFAKVKGDYYTILGFNLLPLLNFFYKKKILSITV
ncbi:MAG: septum formation protein Maf [Rickettsiales bacterium]|nr:septum formation protein Maf [Rickettsiales bacterium]